MSGARRHPSQHPLHQPLLTLIALGLFSPLVAQPQQAVPVRYAEARLQSVNETVELQGTVESQRISRVAAETSGLVTEFPVREGDRVKQGQTLVRLRKDRRELELRAAKAGLEENRTRRALAEIRWRRTEELFQKSVLSKQELDDALFEYEALGKGIERLEAEIARLEYDIKRTEIHAPFDGVIVAEHTQVGEWLDEGGDIVDLLSTQRLEAVVPVPERYFGRLNRRAKARISFESLPDLKLDAFVTSSIPRADPQARTFPVKIAIPSPDRRLGVGMVCQVLLALGSRHEATMIPKDALVQEGKEEAVYVIDSENRANRIAVRSGTAEGVWIEVQGPIQPGQKIITRGNERLRPGQLVSAEILQYPLP